MVTEHDPPSIAITLVIFGNMIETSADMTMKLEVINILLLFENLSLLKK